ncbi:MAG TPA: putative metal-binding motif-containing protein [Archangium sp.]|uniref:putative metal-binding motif-containing protein n=1 Tax=Archangium sp. TaxID=1872627 RepID=UPI002E31ACA9|nr:putative metal-binding motif-containing protein [Archangium sp.]HEX5745222.1 putative metal-binding motif-containing protein [Archangium sp.]
MRHAWIAGCLLLLTACSNKVTDSAVALTVKYPGYTPLCLRVTASDAAASERRSEELISQSKLATDEDRTLILAVYREKSWSQQLQVAVASYATADCTGSAIETRQLDTAVTLPEKGSVPAELALLAQDADKDGHAARAPGVEGTDCDDSRDTVHPGATAVCDGPANLGTDFNCDGKLDCNGGTCTSAAMCGSGFCVGGVCCDSACDEPASQCRGAGTCGTGTCSYPVNAGASCDDGSKCTSGDTCNASGTCTGSTTKTCNTPPGQCFDAAGTCEPSTGDCKYAPRPTTASCDDGKKCTVDDRCDGSGACVAGSPKTCNTPPNTCREATGTCEEATGDCTYAARATTESCDDKNKCTDNDKCDGLGTCMGTEKTCDSPPSQCHAGTCDPSSGSCNYAPKPVAATCNDGQVCTKSDQCDGAGNCGGTLDCSPPSTCEKARALCAADGTCQFEVDSAQVGKICSRLDGKKGTCQVDGECKPFQFSYTVTSNFDPVAIASETINDLDISCGATFDSSGTPAWTFAPGCSFTPPTHVVTADDVVVIAVRNLTVNQPLRVVGSRPVVLAVYGDATLNDEILAHSARAESRGGAGSGVGCTGRTGGAGNVSGNDGSGGGGGGLATESGTGGANDDGSAAGGSKGGALLTSGFSPLVGGCQGGAGGGITGTTPGAGGRGGGSLQLSVAGTLTLASVVSVSGAGGGGGDSTVNNAAGGGGGGSGGMLVLEARNLVVEASARVTANGGAGGEGSDAQGGTQSPGVAGADGSLVTATPVAGADGGAVNGGAGGAGAAGSAGPGDGLAGTGSGGVHGAGGGGGGAAGRILLRGASSCSAIPAGAVISPDTSPNCP